MSRMARLLRGELIKVRTTRTALAFGAAAVLLVVAGVLISILAGDPRTIDDKRSAVAFGSAVGVVLLIFGAVGATGEFRHRTLAPSVLIAPDRLRLFGARIGAYGVTALVVAAVLTVVALAFGLPLLAKQPGPDPSTSDYSEVVVGGVIAVVLAAAVGVGYGTLVRNQVGAVVSILVWLTILEPLLSTLSENAGDYGLGSALDRLGLGGDSRMTLVQAGLIVLAWTVGICIAAALVDRRRDVE